MAASGAPARQPRRGPAPIASFDHDGSDESSPESKLTARLPEIREGTPAPDDRLAAPEPRARSHSTPAAGALAPAPRIDISRASSSSHHDSRDSSPELALFAGAARLDTGFREDGALELRSSTEELAFLEPAPGEPAAPRAVPPAPPAPPDVRHSRKDSQGSEAALLAVSGRTSRISSVGSQCSALSRVSRLSVASGAERSPSPHRMLLETSFCGPKPIETDPEISAGELVDRILGLVQAEPEQAAAPAPAPVDARDRREVRTEVTVESARPVSAAPAATPSAAPGPSPALVPTVEIEKIDKEEKNRTKTEERRARPRIRREPSEPEVYKPRNKSKDVIRIKLRPDESYEEEEEPAEAARPPASLPLVQTARPAAAASLSPARRRSPSPAGAPVSRKSSFCSLFKSRETIASPESPSEALRRKRSLTEGRSRSKSRDRSTTPTSANKIRGSVLSLFRTPRRSGASPSPSSREGSPVVQGARALPAAPPPDRRRADRLKYYEDTSNGIIHIPLRTPPDERGARRSSGGEPAPAHEPPREPRPASAPQPRVLPDPPVETTPRPRAEKPHVPPEPRSSSSVSTPRTSAKPIHRTVLPDGSIIIPLHSPTERVPSEEFPETTRVQELIPVPEPKLEPVKHVAKSATPIGTLVQAQECALSIGIVPQAASEAGSSSPPAPAPELGAEDVRRRRKERLVFTTHVGSREQVFSTQFSITKTPSVTSEISGSFPSFEGEAPPLRDTHIAEPAPAPSPAPVESGAATPGDAARDSSESEPSSEAAPSRAGNDVEKRILVIQQESFEEELPYVPTTLPQERPMALPMVPVRERGGVRVSSTQRPRAGVPPARVPPPAPAPAPPAADKLRIKLPRRPRTASTAAATTPRSERSRTRSGSDTSGGGESRSKSEWIDFSEVPERRKQPKRIQTLPGGAVAAGVVFSYVEPEHCRCECHAHHQEDHTPLLHDPRTSIISTSSAELSEGESQAEPDTPGPELGS